MHVHLEHSRQHASNYTFLGYALHIVNLEEFLEDMPRQMQARQATRRGGGEIQKMARACHLAGL
jgi:hypothetical protein